MENNSKDQYLSENDLMELRMSHTSLSNMKMELAENILAVDRLYEQKRKLKELIPQTQEALSNVEQRIKDQYNAARVDLSTGLVTPLYCETCPE